MAITSTFTFVGKQIIPKDSTARPLVHERIKDGAKMLSLNLGIRAGTSSAYVELFGMERDVINTLDRDNKPYKVNWDERFDPEVINNVAGYRKHVIDLGDEFGGRTEFISSYDAILYLRKMLPSFNGRLIITGDFSKSWYAKNQKYYDHFTVRNIYSAVGREAEDKLALRMDIFFNADSVDDADFDETKKIYLNGYVQQYVSAEKARKYFPHQFVLSSAQYDFDNPKDKKLFDYKMKYIYTNAKTMVHCLWDVDLLNGAEEVEFDESMLTEQQQEQIDLGLATIDDFRPTNRAILGERVTEYRLKLPRLKGEFASGLVDTEIKWSEFEEDVYSPAEIESFDDIEKETKPKKKTKVAEIEDDDDDDLFG